MAETALYRHKNNCSLASLEEAYKILQLKYVGKQAPSHDLKEDEMTIETAPSTILAAALIPEFDGIEYTQFQYGGLYMTN
jgi:hypothetical protein